MIRLTALLLVLFAGAAAAQDTASLKTLADKAYKEGDYMTALQLLDEAFQKSNDPALRANMGLVYNAMGEYASAVESFRAFLASNPPAPKAARAKAFIEKLEPPAKITSTPPGATVYADGNPKALGTTPIDTRLVAGSYDLVFKLPGYADQRARLRVFPERPARVSATLEPATNTMSPFEMARRRRAGTMPPKIGGPAQAVDVATPRGGTRTATWGWLAVGAGAVAAGGAVTAQVLGRQAVDERDAAQTRQGWDDWHGRVETWNLAFLASAGVAAVALTTGAILLIADDAPASAQVGVGPGGVSVFGTF